MCEDRDACDAILDRMDEVSLPTAEELLHLLAD